MSEYIRASDDESFIAILGTAILKTCFLGV